MKCFYLCVFFFFIIFNVSEAKFLSHFENDLQNDFQNDNYNYEARKFNNINQNICRNCLSNKVLSLEKYIKELIEKNLLKASKYEKNNVNLFNMKGNKKNNVLPFELYN